MAQAIILILIGMLWGWFSSRADSKKRKQIEQEIKILQNPDNEESFIGVKLGKTTLSDLVSMYGNLEKVDGDKYHSDFKVDDEKLQTYNNIFSLSEDKLIYYYLYYKISDKTSSNQTFSQLIEKLNFALDYPQKNANEIHKSNSQIHTKIKDNLNLIKYSKKMENITFNDKNIAQAILINNENKAALLIQVCEIAENEEQNSIHIFISSPNKISNITENIKKYICKS
ncbi:hypothetical protein BA920_03450 [Helicobacter pullorum]|uniref:hypothetical protein n=1 Tax=Helicobacter pullorum TaxID=35818 RepID=UPI00081682E4|nr:hypothetical protein [Helicobacter pullorum]OCR05992.1 hypothetical protein BA920_03450 [Helicobacter pullorum]